MLTHVGIGDSEFQVVVPSGLRCGDLSIKMINVTEETGRNVPLEQGNSASLSRFQLGQDAAYAVGGHSFSAAAIEYEILKMKLPHHGPQIVLLLAVEKFKVSEGQRKFAIDSHEPLVTFTLSCGMYSLPSIRIYTAKNVREELEDPQHDYIRAAVAVSNKGRLLVAKNASLLRQKFCG